MAKRLLHALILCIGGASATAAGSVHCPADIDNDQIVGASDLLLLLAQWGTDPGGPPDFDDDGNVGASDLLMLLSNWGACPVIVGIRMEGRLTVAFIETPNGQEFVAVAFDPKTGIEDFSAQRFLGFSESELLELEDIGDPTALQSPEAEVGGNLWSTGIPGDFTPLELGVLSRQSQLLSLFRDIVLPLSTSPLSGDCPCQTNGCTLVLDFDFGACCDRHDVCYCLSGSPLNRLACDATLGACIAGEGHPLLGPLYFAGVRAFGWLFFDEGPRLGACCKYGGECGLFTQAQCLDLDGDFTPDVACGCGPYGPTCPYGGIAQLLGEQRPIFAVAALLTVVGLVGLQMAGAKRR